MSGSLSLPASLTFALAVAGAVLSAGECAPARDADQAPGARTDRFGDALPAGVVGRIGRDRRDADTHGAVHGLAYSADGTLLATCNRRGLIRLWDAGTGKLVRQFRGPLTQDFLCCLTFSPDGKLLAEGNDGHTLRLWEVSTGELVRRFEGELGWVASVAFSPDGKLLAAASNYRDKLVRLFDVTAGKELRPLTGHTWQVRCVRFSPDGKLLASASEDKTARLWDVASGREVRRLPGITAAVHGVAFSPDGQLVAACGRHAEVGVWETATGEAKLRIDTRDEVTQCVAFAPDGKTLATAGLTRPVLLWDAATGKPLRELTGPEKRGRDVVAFAPDGKTLAADGEPFALWDVATGEEGPLFGRHDGAVTAVAFSPDGKSVVTGGQDKTVRFWDAATGQPLLRPVRQPAPVSCLAVTPDGKAVVAGGAGARLLDSSTSKPIHEWKEISSDLIASVAVSGDGRAVAACVLSFTSPTARGDSALQHALVKVWKRDTGDLLDAFPGFLHALAPDGEVLATSYPEMEMVLWDSSRRQASRAFDKPPAGPEEAPPGSQLVVGKPPPGANRLVQVRRPWRGPGAATLSPDGRVLALASEQGAHLWETATGREVLRIEKRKPDAEVGRRLFSPSPPAPAFSPDGALLAVAAGDKKVTFWDLSTGEERGALDAANDEVTALAYSPDGRLLAAAGADGTVLLWDARELSGKRRPAAAEQLGARDLERLWEDLAGDDARRAFRAVGALASAAPQALPFLRERLKPSASPTADRVSRLIADLDDDRYPVRQAAYEELRGYGKEVEAELRKVLEGKPPLEVRRRVEALLAVLADVAALSPQQLRLLRALQALERMGTPEARAVVKSLAEGSRTAWQTRHGRAALERLDRRRPAD